MNLVKRTYSLPSEILGSFEKQVPPENRSSLIAFLLREWLEAHQRDFLRRDFIAGCREMAELYLEVEREFHPLEEEVHRVLESKPKAG